jgi:hypothetical protein
MQDTEQAGTKSEGKLTKRAQNNENSTRSTIYDQPALRTWANDIDTWQKRRVQAVILN